MANCVKCGGELEKDDTFCPWCGAKAELARVPEKPPVEKKEIRPAEVKEVKEIKPRKPLKIPSPAPAMARAGGALKRVGSKVRERGKLIAGIAGVVGIVVIVIVVYPILTSPRPAGVSPGGGEGGGEGGYPAIAVAATSEGNEIRLDVASGSIPTGDWAYSVSENSGSYNWVVGTEPLDSPYVSLGTYALTTYYYVSLKHVPTDHIYLTDYNVYV